jgi:hypothetical protein
MPLEQFYHKSKRGENVWLHMVADAWISLSATIA